MAKKKSKKKAKKKAVKKAKRSAFSVAKSIGKGFVGALGSLGTFVLNGSTWPGEAVLGKTRT